MQITHVYAKHLFTMYFIKAKRVKKMFAIVYLKKFQLNIIMFKEHNYVINALQTVNVTRMDVFPVD